jgi:hypothetical protein
MAPDSRWRFWVGILVFLGLGVVQAAEIPLPSYHYGARIPVSCLNRSM